MQSVVKLKEQLYQIPQVKQAVKWYRMASPRDKAMVKVLAVAVAILLLYLIIWLPISSYHKSAEQNLLKARNTYTWLVEKEPELRAALKTQGGSHSSGVTDKDTILKIASDSAKQNGLTLKRFEPDSQGGLKVWLEDMPFDDIMIWTDSLNKKYGVQVSQVRFDKREKEGMVNARIVLSTH